MFGLEVLELSLSGLLRLLGSMKRRGSLGQTLLTGLGVSLEIRDGILSSFQVSLDSVQLNLSLAESGRVDTTSLDGSLLQSGDPSTEFREFEGLTLFSF